MKAAAVDRWLDHRRPGLIRRSSVEPTWLSDGSSFAFVEEGPTGPTIQRIDGITGAKRELVSPDRLRKGLEVHLGKPVPVRDGAVPFTRFRVLDDDTRLRFSYDGAELIVDLDSYEVSAVPSLTIEAEKRRAAKPASDPEYDGAPPAMELPSPNGKWLLTSDGPNLALRSTVDGRARLLTFDGAKDFAYSLLGSSWSSDSNRIVTSRTDMRTAPRLPVVHWLGQYEDVEFRPYPRTGAAALPSETIVIDVLSNSAVRLDLDAEADRHVTVLRWQPDSETLLLDSRERTMDTVRVLSADVITGNVRTLFTDDLTICDIAYSRAAARAIAAAQLVAGGSQLLWLSDRSGFCHLYLYDVATGEMIHPLTSGDWPVESVITADLGAGVVYFLAPVDQTAPYDLQLCRARLDGSGHEQVTTAMGDHHTLLSPSKAIVIDTFSTPVHPSVTQVLRSDGSVLTALFAADISRLEEAGWCPPEAFIVKAADGETDLYGTLFFPADFDPSKTYPVVDFIYAGPQVVTHPTWFDGTSTSLPNGVRSGFGGGARVLSQLGFIVVVVDGRGTPGRGVAFHQIVKGAKGQNEIPDHVAAIRELGAGRPYMDLDRVGLTGGSWGGYMTLRGVLTAPDFYRVGVATHLVADHFDHMSGIEAIMGDPRLNLGGYAKSDNIAAAGDLRGRLLIIQGTSDVNAPFSAAMKMAAAFVQAGKPFDFLPLPGASHHAKDPQVMHYYAAAAARYLVTHLKPEGVNADDIPLTPVI